MCKTRFSRLDSFCSPPLKLYTPIILCSIEMVSITFREIIFSHNSLVLIAACSLSQNWCSYSSATANSKAKSSRSWQVKKYIVKETTTRLPAPLHRQLAEKKQQIWGRIWFTLQSRLVPDKSKSTLLEKLQLGCLHLCIGNWQKRNNKFEVEYGSHCGKFLCYLIFKTDQEKFEIIIGKSQSWSWQQ
jgi:hypothetical protein